MALANGHADNNELDDDGKHIWNQVKIDYHLTARGRAPRYLDKPGHY